MRCCPPAGVELTTEGNSLQSSLFLKNLNARGESPRCKNHPFNFQQRQQRANRKLIFQFGYRLIKQRGLDSDEILCSLHYRACQVKSHRAMRQMRTFIHISYRVLISDGAFGCRHYLPLIRRCGWACACAQRYSLEQADRCWREGC